VDYLHGESVKNKEGLELRLPTAERPILFSAPMVRAILAGQKTQTRRLVEGLHRNEKLEKESLSLVSSFMALVASPFGKPGDGLWVRETFALETNRNVDVTGYGPPFKDGRPVRYIKDDDGNEFWEQPHYFATDPKPELEYGDKEGPSVRWKPSIHMPRWASRITLEITNVRVERLMDISEEDAIAEGVRHDPGHSTPLEMGANVETWFNYQDPESWVTSAQSSFRTLWSSIYGVPSWLSNPWVFVIEFKVMK